MRFIGNLAQRQGAGGPVVAVCGAYNPVKTRLPDLDVQYASFDDLERVLPEARIAYTPGFDAPEACERFTGHLQWLAEDDATRLLYAALTGRAKNSSWNGRLTWKARMAIATGRS
jgi:hypothetical protein